MIMNERFYATARLPKGYKAILEEKAKEHNYKKVTKVIYEAIDKYMEDEVWKNEKTKN
jgi:hypothetical protein